MQTIAPDFLTQARQCYHQGDLVRAETYCRQALANHWNKAEVLNLLSLVARSGGRLDAAMVWVRQALAADPGNPACHNNSGILMIETGHLAEAETSFRRALQLEPRFPDACNNLSYALLAQGRAEEARSWSEQALQLRPSFAEAHNHLGLALLDLGQPKAATEQFQKALGVRPGLVEAHRNLAKALVEQQLHDKAVTSLNEALRLAPDFAEAHTDLAEVFKQQGRFEDAVGHLRQALRIKPEYPFAYWSLGQFVTQGRCQFSSEELSRMDAMVQNQSLSHLDRSLLHLTLADLHDHVGRFPAAFSHYSQAAALRKQLLQQAGRAFDPVAQRALVDRIIATCDQAFFRPERPAGSGSALPVFVVGMPRSGTTLVQQILSSHSQAAGAGELPDLPQLTTILGQKWQQSGGYPGCLSRLQKAELGDLAGRYLARVAQIGGGALRVVDKRPDNFLHLGLIALLFPQARVIHCRRDPLDACLSCFFQNFNGVEFSWSLEDLGVYHREYQRLMAHWQRVLPLRLLEVSYEDLVARQETVSRELIAFCGLDWQDRCLSFQKNPRIVLTASALQVRRPLYASSVGRWKNYAAYLEPLRRALGSA